MKNHLAAILTLLATAFGATAAHAQTAAVSCTGLPDPSSMPTVTPVTKANGTDFTDRGFECMMWQNFVYLNWPVLKDHRGVPDTNAKFGAEGATTVWESYKTDEHTFRPNGADPGPWDKSPC